MKASHTRRPVLLAVFICCVLALGLLLVINFTNQGQLLVSRLLFPQQYVLLSKDFEFIVDVMGRKYKGRSKETLDCEIFVNGGYEKEVLAFLRDTALRWKDPELVFYDVGAYTGQHSIVVSQWVNRVHAFEPNPESLLRLHDNLALNRINNVTVHEIGLGRENQELTFFPSLAWNPSAGSFLAGWNPETSGQVKVPVKRADDLAADVVRRVDLMKLDVEGYEKNVLIGMKQALEKSRPIIVMELNLGGEERFADVNDLRSTLPQAYELRELVLEEGTADAYSLQPLNERLRKQRNIVMFPQEKRELVQSR